MTITLSQLQAAEKNGTVANLVKQSIVEAAKVSTPVKFVAAKNYKAGSKTLSVFLVVPNQFEFVEHMKKNGGAAVKVASGTAKVSKDEKNHHKIVVESLVSGSAISHNDISTLIKPATGNADGFEGTTPMREQAEKEHQQAEAAQRARPDAGAVRRESLAQAHADFGVSREDFKDVFYPASGQVKVAAGAVAGEFRAAMEKRLQADPYKLKAEDVKVIGLENLAAAQTLVDRARAHANHDELEVVGGLLKNGDLALAVVGPGAEAAPVVLRASFETKVIGRLANPKNAVANIQPGDATIDKAAEAQAKKFGLAAAQKSRDDIDVGGIKVGTVVLAAHGTPRQVGETHVIGTQLGQKTPAQIVALLTENADEKKRLSPKFHGTILLSGCFTAAGKDGVVPANYDYDIFARQVYQLLLKKDYTDFEVQGMPGPSKTDEQGNKTVQPVEAFLKQREVEQRQKVAHERVDKYVNLSAQAAAKEKTLLTQRQAIRQQIDATADRGQKDALEVQIDTKTKLLETVRALKGRLATGQAADIEDARKIDEEWEEFEKEFQANVETYGQRKV